MIKVPVSYGEFFDKLTILQIKSQRIKDKEKLLNIEEELRLLSNTAPLNYHLKISDPLLKLREINENLWDVEDRLRYLESLKRFNQEFIELARSVYFLNDQRAKEKKVINQLTGSTLVEEKSYREY